MESTDPRVDAYIAASAPFARPILEHLRALVHATCPEARETMKWSFPHFEYNGILCSMAAFKAHCAFGFWKGTLVLGEAGVTEGAMGQFGRITSLADLPPDDVLAGYIRRAMRLNEEGGRSPARPRSRAPRPLEVPDYFWDALRTDDRALATFERFSPSHRREYVEWVTEAKGETTRARRLATAVEWLADGKPRNWKYEKR